jgi:hypothetical protein
MKMGVNIGLDIGAISLKLAALGHPGDRPILEALSAAHPQFRMTEMGARPLVLSEYRRIAGSPIQSTYDLLQEFYEIVPETQVEGIRVTGSGSRTIAKVLGLFFENEFKAIARMMGTVYPQVRTVFEIGGESSKYIRLDSGSIVDYDRSGECAAGTGSFLDQQALRMQYSVEEVGELVCTALCAARIAGRCSVFAKSDMIHAQQKGYSPAEILRGLCDAGGAQLQEFHREGTAGGDAGGADRRGFAKRGRQRGAARSLLSFRRRLAGAAGICLVRRHRHRHSGGPGAAQAVHPGDPSPAPARFRREGAGHPPAFLRKRGAVARPRGRVRAAQR